MMLNYATPVETLWPQKLAACLTGGCGAAVIVGIRVFVAYNPGPCFPAFVVLLSGMLFAGVGIGWYLSIRKVEG